MPLIGANSLIFTNDFSTASLGNAIFTAARAGMRIFEIPIVTEDFDAELHRRQIEDAGMVATCATGLPVHLPSRPNEALDYLLRKIDQTEIVGARMLGGALYCELGYLSGFGPNDSELETCADVLRTASAHAAERDIELTLKPFNRYEGYLLNTVAEAVALIERTGSANLKVQADTFHMNIDESSFEGAFAAAGDRLAFVHLSENDRGVPGRGHINWDRVFAGLAAINYQGPLVVESFAVFSPFHAAAAWRHPGSLTTDEFLAETIPYLQERAAHAGLI